MTTSKSAAGAPLSLIHIYPAQRFAYLHAHKDVVFVRDDLTTEYATLLTLLDRPQEAYALIMGRRFHPWEGGEGRVDVYKRQASTPAASCCCAL